MTPSARQHRRETRLATYTLDRLAAECRRVAARLGDPDIHELLEDMAKTLQDKIDALSDGAR